MILVTGATGKTGGATVRALAGKGLPIRVLVRDPQRFRSVDGVEVMCGNFADDVSLDMALRGVDHAYLVGPADEHGAALETAFLRAAQRAELPHLVRISVIDADGPRSAGVRFNRGHAAMERKVRESGMRWTMLRANGFMQNYLAQAEAVATQGVFYSSLSPAAHVALVDVADIGAVAATVLTEEGHDGSVYDLTGPEALNEDEVAARMTAVLGREVRHIQVPGQTIGASMRSNGVPETTIEGLLELWAFFEDGGAAAVSSGVADILGRPPRTIEDLVADHRGLRWFAGVRMVLEHRVAKRRLGRGALTQAGQAVVIQRVDDRAGVVGLVAVVPILADRRELDTRGVPK